MRASSVLSFQLTAAASLRRPWQTFRDGQLWYGITTRGSKRHPLTSKQGNKNFYKGTRSSGYGKSDAAGNYIVNWAKVRTYVAPANMASSDLKALVSPNVPQLMQVFDGYPDKFKNSELAWHSIKLFIELGENYNNQDLEKNGYLEEYIHPDRLQANQEDLSEFVKQ